MPVCPARSSGCDVSESSDVSWSSTVPAARSTSTSTTSFTTAARVTPSSTSVVSLSTFTVPRPRSSVSVPSRRRWMLSVRRPRLPASASRRERRRSDRPCWPTSKPTCGRRRHFGLERRLHTESTGRVFFYALLVSTVVPAGVLACSIENGIDDARMLGCFPKMKKNRVRIDDNASRHRDPLVKPVSASL